MYSKPNIEDMLRAAMVSLSRDIAPALKSSQARSAEVCLAMVQSLLQGAIQRVGSERQDMVSDHNEMTALYRTLAERLQNSAGAAAERIRQRGADLGGRPDIPAPYPDQELAQAHRKLSDGLLETLLDVDQLFHSGDPSAEDALRLLRSHLALRSSREFHTLLVNPGSLAGRE